MVHTNNKKRLQKNASSDFLSKMKYELFRKQFDHLHVKEEYLDIFVIDDEDEIEIIEDEEEEEEILRDEEEELILFSDFSDFKLFCDGEEEDDEEEVYEEEEEISFMSDDEEEDDEDYNLSGKDENAKYMQFTDKIEEFMARIKDVNLFDDQKVNINHFLNYILIKCKPQNKLKMATQSKLKAMRLSYHPDKNVENESKFWMAKCNAISIALNELIRL